MLLKYSGTVSIEYNSLAQTAKETLEIRYIKQIYKENANGLYRRFYQTTFEDGDTVYLRFVPDSDFDANADGGFYVAVRLSNTSHDILDSLLTPDSKSQINRINHVYSFTNDTNNLVFVITSINSDEWSNSTQDRVTMQISIDPNFNSYAEFKIRYDED